MYRLKIKVKCYPGIRGFPTGLDRLRLENPTGVVNAPPLGGAFSPSPPGLYKAGGSGSVLVPAKPVGNPPAALLEHYLH